MTCALLFVDEHHRSIVCIASFDDLNGVIVSLTRAAAEMARRRSMLTRHDASAADDDVAASTFRQCPDDAASGSLVDNDGQVIRIHMRPDVANEMTRNLSKTARAASAC